MFENQHPLMRRHRQAEFFDQLSLRRFCSRFLRFKFAARKLPQSRQVAFVSARQENPTTIDDDGSGNFYDGQDAGSHSDHRQQQTVQIPRFRVAETDRMVDRMMRFGKNACGATRALSRE